MKSACLYHPQQSITNFCRDRNCLLPLCPSCISEHSQLHQQFNTQPQYANIVEVLAEAHTKLNNSIYSLEQDQIRNDNLLVEIKAMPSKIAQQINQAKKVVLKQLEKSFLQLEKETITKLQKYQQQNGVFSNIQSAHYAQSLNKHLDELYCLKNHLKGDKALSTIVYLLKQKYIDVNTFHSQITSYLHTSQSFTFSPELNQQAIYSIGAVISRLLKPKAQLQSKSNTQRKHRQVQLTKRQSSRMYMKPDSSISPIKQINQKNRPYKSPLKTAYYQENNYTDHSYDDLVRRVSAVKKQNEELSRYLNGF